MEGAAAHGPPFDQFNATMTELSGQDHKEIILNLKKMPAAVSSGIGMLMRHLMRAKQSGGAIRLSNQRSSQYRP